MRWYLPKRLKRNKKILESAKGEECTLQIHPYCIGGTATTVPCHLPCEDKGLGTKSPDFWIVYGCRACHEVIDGKIKTDLTPGQKWGCIFRARYRTEKRMIQTGIIQFSGQKEEPEQPD